MASRPSSSQSRREWAESADVGDVSEPSTERPGGFQFEQDFNHDQFNWLVRELFRWVDWFDELFQRGADAGTPGALDLLQSILVGDQGDFSSSQDDSSLVDVLFEHEGTGDSRWRATILEALDRLVADVVRAASGTEIEFQDDQGNSQSAKLLAGIVEAATRLEGDLHTNAIEALTSDTNGDFINLLSTGGSTGGVGFVLDRLKTAAGDVIDVQDGSGNSGEGFVKSATNARAYGRIEGSGTSFSQGDSMSSVVEAVGVDDVIYKEAGHYEIQIPDSPELPAALVASVEGDKLIDERRIYTNTDVVGGDIYIFDSSQTLKDSIITFTFFSANINS